MSRGGGLFGGFAMESPSESEPPQLTAGVVKGFLFDPSTNKEKRQRSLVLQVWFCAHGVKV
jgi:hypothetical protein